MKQRRFIHAVCLTAACTVGATLISMTAFSQDKDFVQLSEKEVREKLEGAWVETNRGNEIRTFEKALPTGPMRQFTRFEVDTNGTMKKTYHLIDHWEINLDGTMEKIHYRTDQSGHRRMMVRKHAWDYLHETHILNVTDIHGKETKSYILKQLSDSTLTLVASD